MNHIYRTINRYHHDFESYRGVITLRSPVVLISIVSFALFVYAFLWYVNKSLGPKISFNESYHMLIFIFFEIITLMCWLRLEILKDQEVKRRLQERFGTKEKNILKLKVIWFEKTFKEPRTEYLRIAENIDKLINLREKHESKISLTKEQLAALIFSNDSKNRILAMVMGICAMGMALCVANGATIDNIFSILSNDNAWDLLLLLFAISGFVLITYLIFRYLALLVIHIIEVLVNLPHNVNSTSKMRASAFIRQLIMLASLEKPRIRIRAEISHQKNQQ